MVRARKYVVTKYFGDVPKATDFNIEEYELPPLKDGEILIKVEWISVDPYQRAYAWSQPLPYDTFGYQVGLIQESKNDEYPVGTRVVSHKGWCDYTIVNPNVREENPGYQIYKLPDLQGLPGSYGVGAVGMPGASAYFGFLEICDPKPGETVVITSAGGALGTLVGQIAKLKGCKVIGFTGSDKKAQWLEKELGFDKAFNYKTVNVDNALKTAAPNGVDCYFDNVGGDLSYTIMNHMNKFGRVSISGSISSYNSNPNNMPKTTILQPTILFRQLKVQGFIIFEWVDRWPEAFEQIVQWIKSGQLIVKEHVTEGFDNIVEAFAGMLSGENFGKAVVKV